MIHEEQQVVESFVPESTAKSISYFAGQKSSPWWKAIDGPVSEDLDCVMESFLECEDMVKLENMCVRNISVLEDLVGAKKPDVQTEGEESKQSGKSPPAGVNEKDDLQRWKGDLQ